MTFGSAARMAQRWVKDAELELAQKSDDGVRCSTNGWSYLGTVRIKEQPVLPQLNQALICGRPHASGSSWRGRWEKPNQQSIIGSSRALRGAHSWFESVTDRKCASD